MMPAARAAQDAVMFSKVLRRQLRDEEQEGAGRDSAGVATCRSRVPIRRGRVRDVIMQARTGSPGRATFR